MSSIYAPSSWPAETAPRGAEHLSPGRSLGMRTDAADDTGLCWTLPRNCSLAPRQLLAVYLALCLVSVGIGVGFWTLGVPAVLPYAGVELALLGTAFWAYARHATDRETILLEGGELIVEHQSGRLITRTRFSAGWVHVEPRHGDGSLVELTGQGQRMLVGRYLGPDLRVPLAQELRQALRRHRRGAAHEE